MVQGVPVLFSRSMAPSSVSASSQPGCGEAMWVGEEGRGFRLVGTSAAGPRRGQTGRPTGFPTQGHDTSLPFHFTLPLPCPSYRR